MFNVRIPNNQNQNFYITITITPEDFESLKPYFGPKASDYGFCFNVGDGFKLNSSGMLEAKHFVKDFGPSIPRSEKLADKLDRLKEVVRKYNEAQELKNSYVVEI